MIRVISTLSYREQASRGRVRLPARVVPASALTRSENVLLLIHGFNNDRNAAWKSYGQFLEHQERLGRLDREIVRVYWPGDTGVYHYHRSIVRAQQTAHYLAADLLAAARLRGRLIVDIVAHSMGCRLSLEILRELASTSDPARLEIRRLIFMAAAIPIRRLSSDGSAVPGSLRSVFDAGSSRILSLYSPDDLVLRFAFPKGQRKADSLGLDDSGARPMALGYRSWRARDAIGTRRLTQIQAYFCDHSHYWPNQTGAVAPAVRQFLVERPIDRVVLEREIADRRSISRRMANGVRRVFRARKIASI